MKREEIQHMAKIAMLEFSDEELDSFSGTFLETMELINRIKKWDTGGLEGTFHVNEMGNHLRKDEIKPSLSQEEATSNALTEKYGYFEIIKFVD